MKRALLSGLVVALLLSAFPLAAGELPDTSKAKEGEIRGSVGIGMGGTGGSYLIVFPVNMSWIDTGIDISDGDTLAITVLPARNHPPCDGRVGCPPYREADAVIADGALGKGLTAVVGRIGVGGTPFSVGKKYVRSVTGPGRLYIGYNDCWGCWGDNTGAFEVTIQVARK